MTDGSENKVVVAMSGGVDSSVAAALLKQQGYDVVGCFMRLGSQEQGIEPDEAAACDTRPKKLGHQGCCSVNDAADARRVAAALGIPLYVLNFKADFDRVIRYFVDEYNQGRTPNPCVRCNDWLKFDRLVTYARAIQAGFIATGHYARVEPAQRPGTGARLLRGCDPSKDQSYFLFGLSREVLDRLLLPIGHLQKTQVRRFAQDQGLPVFDKPDSQEICFVPDNDYANLIKRRTPDRISEGPILDTEGRVVGTHGGQQHFTIGQRRGVAVALGHPVYVIGKDPTANTVTVGPARHLLAGGLVANQTHWLADVDADCVLRCQVKIRHNSPAVPADVHWDGHDRTEVRFDQPQRAVTPGQAVAYYRGEHLMGGAWIAKAVSCPAGSVSSQSWTDNHPTVDGHS